MGKTSSLANTKEKLPVIEKALQAFLGEASLSLTRQNFKRARDHILSCMNERDVITQEDVRSYIQEMVEYHEFVIDGLNRSGISEESLVHILVSADQGAALSEPANNNWKFSLSKVPLPFAVSLFLLVGFALATPLGLRDVPVSSALQQEIGLTAAEELQASVEALAIKEGVSHNKIWNALKAHPDVTTFGYSSSYKRFNRGQYEAAQDLLERWRKNGVDL